MQQTQKKASDAATASARAEQQASESSRSLDEARVRCSSLEVENATLRALTQDVHSEGAEAAGRCSAAVFFPVYFMRALSILTVCIGSLKRRAKSFTLRKHSGT